MRLPRAGDLALTVRQPWAWAIIHAGKDIENRSWSTRFRGRLWIHAAVGLGAAEYDDARLSIEPLLRDLVPALQVPERHTLTRGAIIGSVTVVDCVRGSQSPWWYGPYGLALERPRALDIPVPCRGALGIWRVQPEAIYVAGGPVTICDERHGTGGQARLGVAEEP